MGRGRTTGLVVLGVVLGVFLLLTGLALVLSWPESRQEPWSNPVVAEDGRTITVTVQGGSCDDAEADVDESDERVTITARIVDDWFVMGCDDMGVDHHVTIELDEPLGDRRLVDGAR